MTRISTPFTARSTAAEVLQGVDLTGRRMIVTGGASGIGAAAVRALTAAGADVTIATRNPAAHVEGARTLPLDLADLASVRRFTDAWDGPVDAVIANAGIMALPTLQRAANGWELQLATNYLGHFALLTGLRPHLAKSRVVVVSSGAQLGSPVHFDDPNFETRTYDPWSAYAQSKTAGVLLAVGLAHRWAGDGVIANAMAPGYIHTNLQRHLDAGTMRALGAMDADGNLVTPDHYKTPEQGASTEVLLAASPLLDGVTGRYFTEDNQEAGAKDVADWSLDPDAADRLWELATRALR
jgi:NAD(P)-dependent dehydrogenase (short-subunit alcohol dehydrogenase family)